MINPDSPRHVSSRSMDWITFAPGKKANEPLVDLTDLSGA